MMKQGYTNTEKKPYHERSESDFTWFAKRKFSRLATVFEVFFRYELGSRYFNLPVFLGSTAALIAHRFILFFFFRLPEISYFGTGLGCYYFDWFIVAYVMMSLYHFVVNFRDRSKGNERYSHSMGDPRLLFIARALGFRNALYITYVVIEPLCVFLVTPLVFLYSPYLSVINLLAAFWLWRENARNMVYHRQLELDRQDSEIFARGALELMERPEQFKESHSTHRRQEAHIKPPPEPVDDGSIPSVEEVMQSFEKGDETTIS